jgi:hypothetical protein
MDLAVVSHPEAVAQYLLGTLIGCPGLQQYIRIGVQKFCAASGDA